MSDRNKRHLVLGAAAALLLLALLVTVFRAGDEGTPGAQRDEGQAVAVQTGTVERRALTDVMTYTGTLQPGSQFVLAPKVGGRLRSLAVDIGDTVERGQIVARLDDEEFVQQVAEQRAALEVAEAQEEDAIAQREVALRAYERTAGLRQRELASESEYDVARSEYDAADAAVRVARAQRAQREASLNSAELQLSHTRVRAEWNGDNSSDNPRYVGERFVDEGANLGANEPLLSVIDPSYLRAVIFVTDRDFTRLRRGQSATIRSDALPGEKFSGQVERIAPLLREDTRQAQVEIHVPNEDGRLSPGFFVQVSVVVEELENAVVVPVDALTRHRGERGIFLVDGAEGEPVARWVSTVVGVRSGQYAQILEPDIDGQVVTLGQHRLSDGSRLRPVGGSDQVLEP